MHSNSHETLVPKIYIIHKFNETSKETMIKRTTDKIQDRQEAQAIRQTDRQTGRQVDTMKTDRCQKGEDKWVDRQNQIDINIYQNRLHRSYYVKGY